MSGSLLVNVSKYAASDKSAPIENFITEAFAWLLRNDSEVLQSVYALIRQKASEQTALWGDALESVQISTQVNFNGVFPDMVWDVSGRDWKLVFEHKVWSELHDKQLENYRNFANNHYSQYALVLITARRTQHRQNPDVALCWYEIADCINGLNSLSEKLSWLREEFLALLESNGLLDVTPINPLSLAYYAEVKKLDEQLASLCWSVMNVPWPLAENPYFKLQNKVRAAWGRVGMEFLSPSREPALAESWEPGIFCGFVKDGADHQIQELTINGPLAVLIISIDSSLHNVLPEDEHYQMLVAELHQRLALQRLWKVSDRTRLTRYNPWHPLVIYGDLLELYHGKNTFEQQEQCFIEQMKTLQNVLMECPSFEPFCRSMRAHYKELAL
ncbi:hypothetical protein PY479_10450 [Shewanella sp. A32]|uniref:hypothetical protein n=1 Tax=Shewanella sp. A32 TaxID=3031327 RepID=UPI0023B9EBD3|nr:hypothetical protein [Shewanella sp. A32]MDF0534691.1 hypothetical protein [Shewanella sp. A32]